MSDLMRLLVAKGWAEYGMSLNTILIATANIRTVINVLPVTGYRQAIVYKIIPTILLPQESGVPTLVTGSVTTSDQTDYSNVVTYNVSGSRNASLSEIMLDTNNWAGTQWRISINGTEQFTGQVFNSSPSFAWRQPTQSPQQDTTVSTVDRLGRVLVQARSAAGASITAYAAVTAKEWALRIFTLEITKGTNIGIGTINLGGDLVNNGLDVWARIRNDDPLQYVVTNIGGISGESFAIQTAMLGVQSDEKMDRIQKFIEQFGMQEGIAPQPVLLH